MLSGCRRKGFPLPPLPLREKEESPEIQTREEVASCRMGDGPIFFQHQ